MTDEIRVIRIIEYRGPRVEVEKQVTNSMHGVRILPNGVTITAATLGLYPEILTDALAREESPNGA
jgi:hypothetical protein